MFLNQMQFQRYIQASAKRANLDVRWEADAVPRTDGKTIILPILPGSATLQDYRKLLHYANHEADHVLYTDFASPASKKCDASRSFLGFIWNGVEDVRIEWLGGSEYEGDRANTDEVYPSLFEKGFARLAEAAADPTKQTEERKALLDRVMPILWFMNEAHGDNYASAAAVTPQIEKHLTKESSAYVQKLKDGDYLDQLRSIRDIDDPKDGTEATFQLAKRIFKEVFELDPEEELQRLQEQNQPAQDGKGQPQKAKGQKAKSEPEKGEGDGAEKGDGKGEKGEQKDGDGKGDGSPEKGQGEDQEEGKGDGDSPGDSGDDADDGNDSSSIGPEGEGSESKRDTLVNVKYQEFLPTSHEQAAPEERKQGNEGGMHIDYEGYEGSSRYDPAVLNQHVVADFCRKQFSNNSIILGDPNEECLISYYRDAMANASGAGFAARVRTRLQIRSKDRFEHGVKRGKIQGSLLHRVPRNDNLSDRVFKRRIVNDTLDTAVVWLGDGSGSMGGTKYGHLMAASVQFNEAVGNVIGIPIEVLTFTDYAGEDWRGETQPLMYVHRDFNTRRLGEDELVKRLTIAGQHKRANADGDSILWAYDRVARRREKRKLLIVASDGQPSTSRPGDIDWFTQKVVDQIQKEGKVQIVGIGILDDNVKRIYKEHYVINDAAELEKALLTLIDKKVR